MITASAPAKVNLLFQVGPLQADGYHQVNSLYLELDLREQVSIARGEPGTGIRITVTGENLPERHLNAVPRDKTNLVYKVLEYFYTQNNLELTDIAIVIHKSIPVAGGMAGGSADAAAMMVAVNEFLALEYGVERLSLKELVELGAMFGSDVPFSLLGGLALGTGRGERLVPLEPLNFAAHFVLVISQEGLSTPQVFAKFDQLGAGSSFSEFQMPERIAGLAELMANDLAPAAIALLPSVEANLAKLQEAGALASMVSGSGPTVFGLFADAESAEAASIGLKAAGLYTLTAKASYSGTRLQN